MACFLTFLSLTLEVQASIGIPKNAEHASLKRHVSQLHDSFDFIIVGGGISGLTVANRLSAAFPTKSVLVVEYGEIVHTKSLFKPPNNWYEDPPAGPMWVYKSLPNVECDNKSATIPAGKLLGGCSAVNGQFLDWGSKHSYDAWAEVAGPGFGKGSIKWNWKGLFPVTFTPPERTFAEQYGYRWDSSAYGNGPVQAMLPPFQWADNHVKVEAFQDMGLEVAKECAGGDKHGIRWVPTSQHPVTAARSHSGIAHYADLLPRANYHLLLKHQGIKVIYPRGPKHGPPTVQVRSVIDNTFSNLRAKVEVIISAGGLNTTSLLQRSGIELASFLRKANIPVVLDLPGVGANLQDHYGPSVFWNYSKPYPDTFHIKQNATFKEKAIAQFNQIPARGPYTLAGGNLAIYVSLQKLSPSGWKSTFSNIRNSIADSSYISYLPEEIRSEKTIVAGYRHQLLTVANLLSDERSGFNISAPLDNGALVIDYRAGTNPAGFNLYMAYLRYLRKILDIPTYKALAPVELSPGEEVANEDTKLKQLNRPI
ncbi:GMC oxidoreductase [Cladorrhinum sp. PSN259]|nr:GMC oxidoreductase [Cladorrhinum sp. PSN259]